MIYSTTLGNYMGDTLVKIDKLNTTTSIQNL